MGSNRNVSLDEIEQLGPAKYPPVNPNDGGWHLDGNGQRGDLRAADGDFGA